MNWMLNDQQLAPKTCNLRLTAVHALMEYASQESFELTAYYLEVCSVKAVKTPKKPIEYFEKTEMSALMSAPDMRKKSECRNSGHTENEVEHKKSAIIRYSYPSIKSPQTEVQHPVNFLYQERYAT